MRTSTQVVTSARGLKNPVITTIVRALLFGLLLGGFFAAGFLFRGIVPSLAATLPGHPSESPDQEAQYPLLAQAESLLKDNYIKALPNQTTLEYGAIRGLVATLNDKLTFFIEPPVAASEANVLAGQYGGIGVLVKRDEAGRFVLYPFRDSPATKAGVLDGDILLKVNDNDVPLTMQQDAVDQMLRGEVKDNNGVKIQVRRLTNGQEPGQVKEFTIPFAVIEVPSVIWRTLAEEPTFGYIQILRFTNRTPDELQQAITELRGAGGKGIRALVLDMRNNPGGLLEESIKVASQFLPNDAVILYEDSRTGEKTYKSANGAVLTDLPMVVVVNQGTASAAELVAGALKDNKRAVLLGQKTYGKGSVQLIFQLSDKSSLHVTTAEFFPPGKATLNGVGIEPDIPMIPDQNGRDVELGEAIRYLRDHTK
jgi:carboxyl-terminal processing protease